jgi:3-phosphoshikimate 1-carboxyvinyltransferase
MLEKYTVNPSVNISGSICVPGDKSISHRSLILLSISNGIGVISGLLESDDCMATLKIFKMLGVTITKNINNTYTVHGKGLNGLKKTNNDLDCGNSGTSMRLLAGLLAGQKFNSSLVGDESLFKRPMERISSPLKMMGANITLSKNNTAPILIKPVKKISGIDYKMKIDSAQIKSSIILASLYSSEKTNIYENMPTRDHTENMINFLGGNIIKSENIITINPKNKLVSKDIDIPGDISSAMFIIVGCLISKESEVLIKNVGLNKLRTGGIQILKMMGASIKIINKKTYGP